jgi:hypothetical protein
MQGSSRAAFTAGRDAFAAALGSGADVSALAEDLFGVTGALDSSASLRRALVDPSRDATAKRGLVESLFGPKVGAGSAGILKVLVSQRWADDRDLGDATESLAVEAVVASLILSRMICSASGVSSRLTRTCVTPCRRTAGTRRPRSPWSRHCSRARRPPRPFCLLFRLPSPRGADASAGSWRAISPLRRCVANS